MATIQDIANRLGVSVSTVSKGMNGASDISEEMRQKVLDTAVEMGYTSKKMRKEEFKRLCIFIENMKYKSQDEFGYDLILGFKQMAFRDNWSLSVVPINESFQQEEKYDTYMLKNGYSGAFLLGFTMTDPWMDQLPNTGIPTVLFDNYIRNNPKVGSVSIDNEEGIDLAVSYLRKLGHKNIGFLNGLLDSRVTEIRGRAFESSMKNHGLNVKQELVQHCFYNAEEAEKFTSHFLNNGATALICGNDLMATGIMQGCKKLGVRIPEELSIIGYDDLPISSFLEPPLTTVQQNRLELGKSGYMVLNSIINHVPISMTMLHPSLITRNSTAPLQKKR